MANEWRRTKQRGKKQEQRDGTGETHGLTRTRQRDKRGRTVTVEKLVWLLLDEEGETATNNRNPSNQRQTRAVGNSEQRTATRASELGWMDHRDQSEGQERRNKGDGIEGRPSETAVCENVH